VRFDSGIERGSVVSVEFDPMLAKVISHAPTRTEASLKLALALERTHLHGVTTNRDFLVSTLRSEEFLAGNTTTDFIERVDLVTQREAEKAEIQQSRRLFCLKQQTECIVKLCDSCLLVSGIVRCLMRKCFLILQTPQ
jgi:acetyl/propionyl-CoA carboxylase alpha subunit